MAVRIQFSGTNRPIISSPGSKKYNSVFSKNVNGRNILPFVLYWVFGPELVFLPSLKRDLLNNIR